MKLKLILIATLFLSFNLQGQEVEKKHREPIYDVEADASKQIKSAILQAQSQDKHILLKIGGNWCKWCYLFHDFVEEDAEIKSLVETHFVTVLLNYSRENKNLEVMQSLEFPQRFGFPVFVVLDQDGKRLHTQNTAYFESGEGYDKKEVTQFLNQWSPGALNPIHYDDK